ncbi:uncharacterized protein PFL1_05527 [Pseudozyma flocculosa PF-1]|uniref:Long chronological lifespan protein 2 n=2 Tax=Pseudozyma flocculosa TaxID=84751 RepID=A0A5C3FCL2_9BASI|nr:uncharacterized protein PFL1_05527 [Pseudozyma flocculosa PF-1]EPQ26892.1 hypothetical protein PFL1_05527 [Pseudozyma flocculosa PF-1]SPO41201.1 uncharacterized protein PSFLO_06683 [Pseudozyma flocculosa]
MVLPPSIAARRPTTRRQFLLPAYLLVLLALAAQAVHAQIFQNFFGGHNGGGAGGGGMFGGHAREQEPPPSGDARWFHERVNAGKSRSIRWSLSLQQPSHCPCPFPQQIRCSYRDTDSAAVERSDRAGGSFDGVDAQLDLGGTFCVTATDCEEVQWLLDGGGVRSSA